MLKIELQCVQNHTKRWGHEECAGADELQVAYTCNLCVE